MSMENPMKSYRRYKGGRNRTGRRLLFALLALIVAGALLFGGLLAGVLLGSRDDLNGEPGIIMILGCQVMPNGNPSTLLKDRLDTALDYLEENPDTIVVVSGGQGENEPCTEASCMARYLIRNGVRAELIREEDQSRNTWENLSYSLELLAAEGLDTGVGVAVVSNGFHLTRVRMLWERVGDGGELSTLSAPSSHLPSRLYMYIREPLALVKSFIFDRG